MATHEHLRQAFLAHRRKHGQAATISIISRVAGVDSVADVPEEKRDEVLRTFERESPEADPSTLLNDDGTLNNAAIWNRWNGRAS